MPAKRNWTGWIEFIGVLAFFLSVMEPWKWSPMMMAGSGLIAWTAYLKKRRRKRSFLIGVMMISFGAAYWLLVVVLLSMRVLKSHTGQVQTSPKKERASVSESLSMGPSVAQAVSKKKFKKPKRLGNLQP